MDGSGSVQTLVAAAAAVGAGLLAGIVGRIVAGRVIARARTNRWMVDDLVCGLVRDLALPLALAAGSWAAVLIAAPPPEVHDTIARVIMAALVLAATLAVMRLVGALVASATAGRDGVAQSATIFVTIAKAVVLAIGVLILLQGAGISITPLLTAMGVGGLAVALALQETLANLFAGIHILVSRKVQQGDYVCLDSGEEGHIVDINWRNTTIRQLVGNVVIVPNAKFADAIMTNYHRPQGETTVPVAVGVSYDSDLEHVERVTIDVARGIQQEITGAVTDHEPFVRYHTFGESSIDLKVFLRTHEYTDHYLVVHEFIKRLHDRYRTEGIEIPFPMRSLILRGGAPAAPEGAAGAWPDAELEVAGRA